MTATGEPSTSTSPPASIRIEFGARLDPAAHAALAHAVWAVLVASGHATRATIHLHGGDLADVAEALLAANPLTIDRMGR